MRGAGIATVQQTLTSDAAAVLKRAIGDAQRRGHSQVTPLHVAASLIASPAGMLQHACIQSHRQAPHPLHCRALELCFNVALERLPAANAQNSSSADSGNLSSSGGQSIATLSNALVAALKRAQAHQRRGCPEQQQVPLLAVKVEMEQLVISILDDPSVSRVMREAGFSSTRAKNSLEAALHRHQPVPPLAEIGETFRTGLGPCSIEKPSSSSRETDAAIATLSRRRKRNPVLLGDDGAANSVLKELVSRIEGDRELRDARILFVERGFGFSKDATQRSLVEISGAVEECGRVVAVLGSLAWCVEVSAMANAVMGDLAKILDRAESKLWLIATASSQCYMRFLAQYPAMESGLGFQPLPISTNSIPSIRPRFSLVEKHEQSFPRFPKMLFKLPDEHHNFEDVRCCVECTAKLEHESLVLLQERQSKTESVQSSSGVEGLPLWMTRNNHTITSKPITPQEPTQLTRELRKKWSRYCQLMHSKSCLPSLPNLIDSNSSSSQTSSPNGKIQQASRGLDLSSKPCLASAKATSSNWLSLSTVTELRDSSGPALSLGLGSSVDKPAKNITKASKVTTELALGTSSVLLESHHERLQDTSGCKQSSVEASKIRSVEIDAAVSFKSLHKKLCERVPWQSDAAGKIASTVSQCRAGDRKRGSNVKGDTWLLLTGPDVMGKRKMAKALAEVYNDGRLVLISLNPRRRRSRKSAWESKAEQQDGLSSRGRTVTDRIADAVKLNPFSVFLLEEFDKADAGVKAAVLGCIERGKIQHSSGREVSFGNTVTLVATSAGEEVRSGLEERLEGVEPREIRVVVDEQEVAATSSEIEVDETKNSMVSVIQFKQSGEEETVLVGDGEAAIVGEKRKSRVRWGEKLACLLDPSGTRRSKVAGLDLNLGLGCSSLECEDGGGHFDEVVCFREFEVESTGEIVMERLERMAGSYGVCVKVDVRVVEMMMGFVWEEMDGSRRFERWMEQWIEGVVKRRSGTVRIVAGEVLVEQGEAIAGKNRSLLGQVCESLEA
ncbi:protein SMAX1-LIKE 2-like [Selaginella moellendorffii]|uniref:protein SMAX1-LIKE 2-like n=1 Tax=Selaginella moellendorffii TaxID=88036 RepID=UPI000D1C2882|nr:protein SMAX1-LIKE 2-like [Selaginella moellendorffii]|eukprot:XP_024542500.1 protein SMAX1-LIKE 2-like [Selaginella moellendorffii]